MRVEIPDEITAALEAEAQARGQDVAALVVEMLTEAIKMRRVPGILFADGPTGRRARIGGTGIEVFEVIDRYELVGRDRERLRQLFNWLTPEQLEDAIAYYETFPEEITPYLLTEQEEEAELQALWAKYPQTSPDWPGRRRGAPSKSTVDAT